MEPDFKKKIEVEPEEIRDFDQAFASHMKMMREERGLKRDWVARRLGVHYNTLKNWELGKSHPGTREIIALSKIYHCRPGDFFEGI